jgi:hypothetical protein
MPIDMEEDKTVSNSNADQTSQAISEQESPEQELITALKQEKLQLLADIEKLRTDKAQISGLQSTITQITQENLAEYQNRKQELSAEISVLQRKYERLQTEMKTIYAGASQDVAVRVQGFKDYLLGSLQDLVGTVEKLHLVPKPAKVIEPEVKKAPEVSAQSLTEQAFGDQKLKIEQLLERYRTLPDYYGPAWKLRRTFEASHADRVSNWFFAQAGRGAVRTMGTRLQNILVASAAVSILRSLYGDKVRVLILATSPERLGEWRRGFQDCLGINRENFGPEKGIVLFEDPDPLCLKGDRLTTEGQMPLIIIDEAEESISVDMLRFPLLLGFGRDPAAKNTYFRERDF